VAGCESDSVVLFALDALSCISDYSSHRLSDIFVHDVMSCRRRDGQL